MRRDERPWLRWVIGLAVLVVVVGLLVYGSINAVQQPYLVQARFQGADGWRYALVVVPRNPSPAELQGVVKDFAARHKERPLTAEFYTRGQAATAFEGGGPPDDAATAAEHIAEFKRPDSGNGQGWVAPKGAQDSNKQQVQAP